MSKTGKIPMLDLSVEIEALWDEINAAVQRVLRSGQFIMGPEVEGFEREAAEYLGVRHAVGVNSGTDALVIALRALGIGSGDEVIVPSFTFFATAEAVSLVGATPVFADIDPRTYNVAPERIEERITSRTRAILPVHLFGQAVQMDRIRAIARDNRLVVVEDVAQAFGGEYRGRKLGSIGDAGAFSFFPSKNLGAYGDGGLIATDDDDVAEQARMLRTHGAKKKYHNETIGYNSRLDALQAAILRVKLAHIDEWNEGRRAAARRYGEMLADVSGVETPYEASHIRHVYHQYTVRVRDGGRDAVRERLAEAGVGTMVYYPVPVHLLPVYAASGYELPATEAASGEVLSLPIWPQMARTVQEQVVDSLREALK
ncbi:DegT/DnrJ/EryC1/StrS family aminotransferase [Rubrobacter taiwanensis]|uniref:DegT/DnrJ/EryC1/StrS family aminotransferase n=1 Tax=Rubrobacter taiwanensis TaxID=185139 RepID=A0A4R1BNM6_9ACTN|nr:DegT/DnrJ/EryC1/StrS family aminotransferase [Rubrobacter taiwanensis]TCJ18875.1 DegT/DnrJ/EryC1/StrS family aminotransferase [Rubrobacter taiwanensis]